MGIFNSYGGIDVSFLVKEEIKRINEVFVWQL